MKMYHSKPGDLNYPEGSILFDVRYCRKPECFEVVYWSPITNQLEVQYEEPIVDIWFLKEELRNLNPTKPDRQIAQAKMKDCYPIYCKPSKIPEAIARNVGGQYEEYFDQYKDIMSFNELKKYMCQSPHVFKADFQPDVYFRLRWLHQYGDTMDVSKVQFGFVDIETDVLDQTIDPKNYQSAPQPINAVSVILPHVKICALLVLGPRPKHKLHPRFHNLLEKQEKAYEWLIHHQEEFKRKVVETDPDNKKYLQGYDIRLHIFPFDEEIHLIKTVFDYINKYRPWFTLSWNAPFDDNYLMNRISYLGYDPKDFIIPKQFKTETLYFSEDKTKNFQLKTNRDFFYASSYSVYLCQMRTYAAIRKSQAEKRSMSLSSIGKAEAKIDKLTNTKSGTFREFAYTDFIKFLLYNIRDVVVQLAIESKCGDCGSLVARSYTFATSYPKCFQETHIVRNRREFFYEKTGFVQACYLINDSGVDPAFEGAFVADPALNAPTGLILNGKPVNNIMFGSLDADAASYYPSTKMGMNMDPMSLLYKCRIDNQIFAQQCINRSFNQEYIWYDSKNKPHDKDMSGPIINSYKNGNINSLLFNWFNLPSITNYFEYIDAML